MNEEPHLPTSIHPKRDPEAQIPEGYEDNVNLRQLNAVRDTAKDYGQLIRDRLRSKTGLTAHLGKQSIELSFSNKIPGPFDEIIKQIGNPFWKIRQNELVIQDARRVARDTEDFLFDRFPEVAEQFGLDRDDRVTLATYQKLMARLLGEIAKIQIKEQMLRIEEDIFGAYFPSDQRIEIYWIPIALFSESINVPIEEFTKVILTHEFAHGFTHVGKDLGQHRWDTKNFCETESALLEGLAQYYTATITRGMRGPNKGSDKVDAYDAYEKLLEFQSPIYHAHEMWMVHDEKEIDEAIRFAILEARRMDVRCTHEMFTEMIAGNLRRLGARQ